ncbi:hypothetical protein FIBSPDRAFT_904793 [Athelia psychrophila]|uniref:Uncharacterized protein n=1 Tax=Athelia psychrophila TaxID=1759441 RepID=A0A167UA06_9AGAM|nr:hypothetical protein FIBSPDRAFT_904793 [Fibularhizoctonia sp. CBS 109695]
MSHIHATHRADPDPEQMSSQHPGPEPAKDRLRRLQTEFRRTFVEVVAKDLGIQWPYGTIQWRNLPRCLKALNAYLIGYPEGVSFPAPLDGPGRGGKMYHGVIDLPGEQLEVLLAELKLQDRQLRFVFMGDIWQDFHSGKLPIIQGLAPLPNSLQEFGRSYFYGDKKLTEQGPARLSNIPIPIRQPEAFLTLGPVKPDLYGQLLHDNSEAEMTLGVARTTLESDSSVFMHYDPLSTLFLPPNTCQLKLITWAITWRVAAGLPLGSMHCLIVTTAFLWCGSHLTSVAQMVTKQDVYRASVAQMCFKPNNQGFILKHAYQAEIISGNGIGELESIGCWLLNIQVTVISVERRVSDYIPHHCVWFQAL